MPYEIKLKDHFTTLPHCNHHDEHMIWMPLLSSFQICTYICPGPTRVSLSRYSAFKGVYNGGVHSWHSQDPQTAWLKASLRFSNLPHTPSSTKRAFIAQAPTPNAAWSVVMNVITLQVAFGVMCFSASTWREGSSISSEDMDRHWNEGPGGVCAVILL